MKRAREIVPGAEFVVLDDVGHVPMLDDPRLVAETILGVTGAASAAVLAEGLDRLGSAGEGSETA